MFLKLFTKKRYTSEESLKWALKHQFEANVKTLKQLSRLGITHESRLKLQFFYCTNRLSKAKNLSQALEQMNYLVESIDKASKERIWIVSGWTNKIKMDPASVTNWTKLMIQLGHEYDCEFDGWGTYTY